MQPELTDARVCMDQLRPRPKENLLRFAVIGVSRPSSLEGIRDPVLGAPDMRKMFDGRSGFTDDCGDTGSRTPACRLRAIAIGPAARHAHGRDGDVAINWPGQLGHRRPQPMKQLPGSLIGDPKLFAQEGRSDAQVFPDVVGGDQPIAHGHVTSVHRRTSSNRLMSPTCAAYEDSWAGLKAPMAMASATAD